MCKFKWNWIFIREPLWAIPSSGSAIYKSQDITSIGITALYKIALGKVNSSRQEMCTCVLENTVWVHTSMNLCGYVIFSGNLKSFKTLSYFWRLVLFDRKWMRKCTLKAMFFLHTVFKCNNQIHMEQTHMILQ